MVKRVRTPDGWATFPDEMSDEEIEAVLRQEYPPPPPPPARRMGAGEDVARSVVSGAHSGAASVFGAVGDLQEMNAELGGVGLYWMRRAQGMSDEEARADVQANLDRARSDRRAVNLQAPTTQSVNDAWLAAEPQSVREWTGHEPQRPASHYAYTAGAFAPMALLPGSGALRAARVVVPAATTETAGQVARQVAPEYETPVRIGAAIASAGVTEGIGAGQRGARPQRTGPAPDPEEFLQRTAGERAGNTSAIQRENELRRSRSTDAGGNASEVPEQAQRILRDFDDRRAATLENNLLRRIATRGRDPVTESVGDAGVVVADDLRSGYEAMLDHQSALYRTAHDLSSQQPIARTDELGATVEATTRRYFLPRGPWDDILNRLDADIRSGEATFETAEFARQQLNVHLGDAMRNGSNAEVVAIHRLIDVLDDFVEQRLTGDAQVAIHEARGFTQEMMNLYGEQARPDLSTGHVGRRDPGGRVVQIILETDITGEQVIDSIFGAGGRPPRSALAAVRRIRDRATRSIVSGGYEAPTGGQGRQQRAPGRASLRGGRSTRGGRQLEGPSEAQQRQYGLEANEAISDPALQALREAFIYRIARRLRERSQGDAIPARQMANDLRAALDGPGAEITPLLFNGEEIALMRRALADLESVAPPRGSYNPSAPGVAQAAAERSFAAIAGRVMGRLPVVGPSIGAAIQEGVVNARAIRDARAAVAQPTVPSSAAVQAANQSRRPSLAAPVVAGVIAANDGRFYVGDRAFDTRGEAEAYARRVGAARR